MASGIPAWATTSLPSSRTKWPSSWSMNAVACAVKLGRLGGQLGQGLGQPVRDGHVPAAQRADQLGLVVAGHRQGAARLRSSPCTSRSTAGVAGPRSTRSPTKTAVRPSRVHRRRPVRRHLVAERAQQVGQLVEAAVDVADDVERPVLGRAGRSTAARARWPPRRSRRCPTARAPGGSPRGAGRADPGGAGRAAGAARARRTCGRCGPRCGPRTCPRARPGRSRRPARGAAWPARPADCRASGWTLVASMTVSRPAASRLAAMKCSTSKASAVAAWSFSSSLTSAAAEVRREHLGRPEVRARERRLARSRRCRPGRRGTARGS